MCCPLGCSHEDIISQEHQIHEAVGGLHVPLGDNWKINTFKDAYFRVGLLRVAPLLPGVDPASLLQVSVQEREAGQGVRKLWRLDREL